MIEAFPADERTDAISQDRCSKEGQDQPARAGHFRNDDDASQRRAYHAHKVGDHSHQHDGAAGIAENVRYAVLIDNVASAERVEYRARTIDRRITKDWFVFPWEAVADRESVLRDATAVPERIA